MANLNEGIALYIDFENLARGFARSSQEAFDIHLVLGRLVEKGKVVMNMCWILINNSLFMKEEINFIHAHSSSY